MTIAPVQPVQPLMPVGYGYQQPGGITGYETNVPGAAELQAGSDLGTKPFAGSRLIAAQMERQSAIEAQNKVAQAAAAEQARQFDIEQKNKLLQMQYGALSTPFGGEAARGIGEVDPGAGWDTGRIQGIEDQAKAAAAATIFNTNASGLGTISQAGGDVNQAAAKVPGMEGVNYGPTPAERASTADNATALDVARIGANASMYGSDQQLRGAMAAGDRDKFTVAIPPQLQSTYGALTAKVGSLEEAQAMQNEFARMMGGAQMGSPGGGGGETPVPNLQLRAITPAIQERARRDGWNWNGVAVRRPDGSMVARGSRPDGTPVEIPLQETD